MSFSMLIALAASVYSVVGNPDQEQVVPVAAEIVDCNRIVDDVLSETGGRLLSVRQHPDRCTVTVLVPKTGERPARKVFRVPVGGSTGK